MKEVNLSPDLVSLSQVLASLSQVLVSLSLALATKISGLNSLQTILQIIKVLGLTTPPLPCPLHLVNQGQGYTLKTGTVPGTLEIQTR